MRILVHEFVTGGGLAGQDRPAALVREGMAMRDALVEDLTAIASHTIVSTVDARFPPPSTRGVEVVTMDGRRRGVFDQLVASVDAVWLIAPESHKWIERAAQRVERAGTKLLGPGSRAVHRASDKAALPRRLGGAAPHPATVVVPAGAAWIEIQSAAGEIGYPVVVKPRWGAGCLGVGLANDPAELRLAVEEARRAGGREALVVQRYLPGVAASVSLLADGSRTVALAVNGQSVRVSDRPVPTADYPLPTAHCRPPTTPRPLVYRGGVTPLDHPMADRAVEVAQRACDVLPGLRGFVGVDLVLTDTDAVVIEVNPRLTTSYLGVRSSIDENIAAMAMDACAGILPRAPRARHHVRFTADGHVEPLNLVNLVNRNPSTGAPEHPRTGS